MTLLNTHPCRLTVDADERLSRVRWLCIKHAVPPKLTETITQLARIGELVDEQIVTAITVKALGALLGVKTRTMKARVQRIVDMALPWLQVEGHNWGTTFTIGLSDRHTVVHTAVHTAVHTGVHMDVHTAVHTEDVAQPVQRAGAVAGDTYPDVVLDKSSTTTTTTVRSAEPETARGVTTSPQGLSSLSSSGSERADAVREILAREWLRAGYQELNAFTLEVDAADLVRVFGDDLETTQHFISKALAYSTSKGAGPQYARKVLGNAEGWLRKQQREAQDQWGGGEQGTSAAPSPTPGDQPEWVGRMPQRFRVFLDEILSRPEPVPEHMPHESWEGWLSLWCKIPRERILEVNAAWRAERDAQAQEVSR